MTRGRHARVRLAGRGCFRSGRGRARGGGRRRWRKAAARSGRARGQRRWRLGRKRGRRCEPTLSAISQRPGAARGGTTVAIRSRTFVDSDELLCRFGGATLDDDDEPDRGVQPGAVALAISLNGGADFGGGDSSGVPGVLAFEYVASIAVSSLAPRAGPTSGTALHVFGEASRSRPNSRACSAAPRAATPPRRPSWARPTQHSAARERSAAAAMWRTPARERLSFVLVVRRSI